ncbi:MAG: ATP-dependent Clp protease proteolytic subunit [Armatimonadetes bacterium]|nr:ATP-dependent Clp protease proteolytic subunit [Akkermansiaceae bacterium]
MKIKTVCIMLAASHVAIYAKEAPVNAVAPPATAEVQAKSADGDANTKLEVLNKLEAEKLTHATNDQRAEITKLKLERELITERLALESAKRKEASNDATAKSEIEIAELTQAAEVSKIRAEKLSADLKSIQSEMALELARLQTEIETIQTKAKRETYADSNPIQLKNPLREDGVLVISERRIPLNGMIVSETADFVTSRIDFWNNRNRELPIFIVIDDCPGGSVMAGYRILKAMEASDAPIHVVVKSFAASMAACITTLAKESYAYPNAVILHHQISSQLAFARLNLTQQKEFYQESQRWWERLAAPVAEKMGVTTDKFIEEMYARSSSGDWSEFGDRAKELKWVNHIVEGIVESSITLNPDADTANDSKKEAVREEVDSDGKVFSYLPRLNPKDVYFLYNPDGYYRMR